MLGLHGAMVADGYDDCEGDLLSRTRGRRELCPERPAGVGAVGVNHQARDEATGSSWHSG
jgi:Metallopeptidase family M81